MYGYTIVQIWYYGEDIVVEGTMTCDLSDSSATTLIVYSAML